MTNPTITSDAKTTVAPAKRPTVRPRPAPTKKRSSGFSWKGTILAASVGITLFGSTTLTRMERADAAAVAAQDAQATAVVQAIQALESAQATRSAQISAALAAQMASNAQPRTIVVKVPVAISGGQPATAGFGGQSGGQPSQASQPSQQASVNNAPAPAPAAIVMPAMPAKPVFHAPVTSTRKS